MTGRELVALDACGRYKSVSASQSKDVIGEAALFLHSHETPAFGLREYLASIRKYRMDPDLLERLWTLKPEPQEMSATEPASPTQAGQSL